MHENAAVQERVLADLEQLARPRHARWDELGLLAVRTFVLEQLQAHGPVEQHHFGAGADAGVNLILRLPGQRLELAPVLVAALLELARRWAQRPPRRPVWLVAFDQEEWGMVGSKALAGELRRQGQPLHLMLSLEMLGYTAEQQRYPVAAMRAVYGSRGDFIALVANAGAAALLPGLSRAMGAHVKTKVLPVPFQGRQLPDVRLSDHSPFWDAGYNAVMVTDTSFMRNPHYHQSSDTIETLDLPFLLAVIDGLEAAIAGC
jgi:hypothetical protein